MDPSSQPFKVLAVDDSAIYRKLVEPLPLSRAVRCTVLKQAKPEYTKLH